MKIRGRAYQHNGIPEENYVVSVTAGEVFLVAFVCGNVTYVTLQRHLLSFCCKITRKWIPETYLSKSDRVSATYTICRGQLRDLETLVGGHSRSLAMAPFDRSHKSSY